MSKEWTMVLGRFQVIPPHPGHLMLIDRCLERGDNIVIALREEDGTDKNPFTHKQRKDAFKKIYKGKIKEGRLRIIKVPDVIKIVHGRKVGWSVEQVKLPDEIEAISGTEERKKIEKDKK